MSRVGIRGFKSAWEKWKKRTRVDLEFTGSFRYQVISYSPEYCKALREVIALHLVIMNFY